ncbi:hypothetical protein [Gellertiella hungarica]|uniref:Uncharacterized protein n=1 Tax=Gellertiella hungarica TaxID=1572859 RepID=A0A7W6NLV7_9HYPH|nr:hypothetical protein [Gellertiella hungarica]MBB4065737.1 hypothetical protein [Gellertiella hungarica]
MENDALAAVSGDEPPSLASMADLMARIRVELDQQFQLFTMARSHAERLMRPDLPEAEQKLLRADMKAAVDALSVIVRTLEKVDEMERRLAREQAELAALAVTEADYDRVWADVAASMEERIAERLVLKAGPNSPPSDPDWGPGGGSGPPQGADAHAV